VDFAVRRTTEVRLLPSTNHRYQSSAYIGQNGPLGLRADRLEKQTAKCELIVTVTGWFEAATTIATT
jgi:hypothetical protein